MYQIDFHKFKDRALTSFHSTVIRNLTPPTGADVIQYNIKKKSDFRNIYRDIKETHQVQLSNKMYCFYCGDPNPELVPGFLHNGSGINVWMYATMTCASMICKQCNIYAGSNNISYNRSFSNITKYKTKEVLKFEPNILIPNLEPVHLHFDYKPDGILRPLTVRAENTIKMFSLNREQLVSRRLRCISSFNDAYDHSDPHYVDSPIDLLFCYQYDHFNQYTHESEYYPPLEKNKDMEKCYQLIHKMSFQYVGSEFIAIPFRKITFKELLTNQQTEKGRAKTNFLGVDYIDFNGLRGFDGVQRVKFNGKNSIIIIGENGVGKSTLLQLIGNALKVKSRLPMGKLVNEEGGDPFFKIKYNQIDQFYKYKEVTHKSEGKRSSCNLIEIGESRVSSSVVHNFNNWIKINQQDEELISWVARQLKVLLNIDEVSYLNTSDNSPHWHNPNLSPRIQYLEHMSSGYRSIMFIFYSIIKKLTSFDATYSSKLPDLNKALSSTIVLIDEIELHLHPIFKKEIVQRLQDVFPEVLFIVTTHDPLVLKSSTNNTKVMLLEKSGEENKTVIRSELPNHFHMSTEQILTSPIFGLSTVSDSAEKQLKIDEYQSALKAENWEVVDELRDELSEVGLFGNTYREFIALSAVDVYLAKNKVPTASDIVQFLSELEGETDA